MSFGNEWTEIDLDKTATTLVVGKNGSGKSSGILDTISFALFNKPFRNITKPQLTNSISSKQCLVELYFTANGYEFLVRRGQKPTVFEIYKDGELLNQTADNRDYQDAFEKYILKVNHKTFCQIVMLGSAIFTPFMALPAAARRSVIEDLLDLQIFTIMNQLLGKRYKEVEELFNKHNAQEKVLVERKTLLEEHIKKNQVNRDELVQQKFKQIGEHAQSIVQAQHEIVQINFEMEQLLESVSHQPEVESRERKITKLRHQLGQKRTMTNSDVSFLEQNKDCPTCKQVIETEFKNKTIKEKRAHVDELSNALKKLETEKDTVQKQKEDIEDILKQIQFFNGQLRALDANAGTWQGYIEQLKREIHALNADTSEVDVTKLEDTKKELEEVNKELAELKTKEQLMDYATTLLKDSGIKSKIVKTFIPVINQLINKYLASLDFFVEFSLNEQFEEKILSRFRDEFSYESFSEGEKMRLNIAILFAWRALAKLRGSIDCNLIILDELLDGSLDDEGLSDVIVLLRGLTSDENVFIISHKDKLADAPFDRVLHFKKVSNFSRIE